MSDSRLQIPGGSLTIQDLRDLVGWAGAAGARTFRMGDAQDLFLENAANTPSSPPPRLRFRDQGSLQSSAFGEAPSPALPWLTTGVWMDLLALLPDPGALDVQVVHEPVSALFLRHGHLRLTARKAAHQWQIHLRRPGSDRLLSAGQVDTGDLPQSIIQAREAWEQRDEKFWHGEPAESIPAFPFSTREGFHRETATSFSFGLFPPAGRLSVDRLRDLTWLASETGASRVWLTPSRVLLFEGLPQTRKKDWVEWLAKNRLPETHGDLEHAVSAGWGKGSLEARNLVLENLRDRDRMPPNRRLLVADEALNRGDGVCSTPYPVVIRTAGSWLYRSGDGRRSGEGNLDEVLDALDAPIPVSELAPSRPATPFVAGHRCSQCLTVYESRYGDPGAGIAPGTSFDNLPVDWKCPVCGGPPSDYTPLQSPNDPMRRLSHGFS